ncbi:MULTISPECIES: AarF/ABC1/UbiB kinase family protein [unclassified Pseudomonas]|uniref:ABC1 kinase family protein n=1 Tax=unclassified Pseudomonas TaxID=196821 RepID=UPI002AC8BF74|nr:MULTISPECIES: AarF/ABC1/UbiB kinase family protein [unclassified Pseudomonas]MEB0045627.1 AarF/ABC1/UbiB kinase family protein [Pseudomonas sp. Dout3]MEB0095510.1 AarF/ABC1/UbiB kinase family protein [Pseudomonas sp. DC1.2]WPX61092.1 AarF/ABC1/UbiB kinase family protein [Pseudomonas sp. DC1.2]
MKQREPGSAVVPSSRLSRLMRFGGLASGVAGGMLAEGARQLAQGNRPALRDLLLTPGNVHRAVEQLSQLRGAAMKVGQLLSMDAGELLPRALAEILSRLRADAHPMPMSQLVAVLNESWGKGWEEHFERFSFTPLAAASIGQVHAALGKDGQRLAIKVQYPGVRESISSDVDNVATLLRVSGLLPKGMDLAPLLQEAKRQLQDEADYLKETEHLRHFHQLLADSPEFLVPRAYAEFSTPNVLVMSFADGVAVESLEHAPQAVRDRIILLLFGLLLREVFEFQCVQTDPNFANYRYQQDTGRMVLLDFGATRLYARSSTEAYRRLLIAGLREDRAAIAEAALEVGYFQPETLPKHRTLLTEIISQACEPLRYEGAYDFATSDLASRLRDTGWQLGTDRDFWHTPPVDVLFLHRKVGGLYLLAAKLKARVDVRRLFQPYVI